MNKKIIIKYKIFGSSFELESWQHMYNVTIYQVMPLVSAFVGDVSTHGSVSMESNIGVFVTYVDNPEINDV